MKASAHTGRLAGWRIVLGLALGSLLLGGATPEPAHGEAPAWQATEERGPWVWEKRFDTPRPLGALCQVLGDHPFVLRRAPRDYHWEATRDGRTWRILRETRVGQERRRLRVLRFPRFDDVRAVRLVVHATTGGPPALERVEFFAESDAPIPAPAWIAVVNSTHDATLPGHGQEFIPLARSCAGWEHLEAQQVWVPDLDPAFLAAEPRPLAVFLSGSFKDWCEVDRTHWRGVEAVLAEARQPIWASCGGAQALAILATAGTRRAWDCPHCRDPRHPRLPVYGHIGHLGDSARPCGDYSACVFERGPHVVRQLGEDPAFRGLPETFPVMESHCGQIEFVPFGWERVVEGGPGTQTRNQCLRRRDRPIYAAQFHIEMAGTPEVSRAIMANFLRLAASSPPAPAARRYERP